MKQVQDRAVHALKETLASVSGRDALSARGYAVALKTNLLYPMSPETQRDYAAGAGRELDRNMLAPHSSSALVVNTFERWRDHLEHLELAEVRSFETIAFEKKYPTGLPGTPPHLDLVAANTEAVVAVESKCLEYLTPTVPHFEPSYQRLADEYGTRSWFRYVAEEMTGSLHLNVAQLVRHWLGLCRAHPDRRVTLLYLYWEPDNWRQVPECRRHRREIQDFTERVEGDEVRFAALSYPELWAHWGQSSATPWIEAHVSSLRQRYAVAI